MHVSRRYDESLFYFMKWSSSWREILTHNTFTRVLLLDEHRLLQRKLNREITRSTEIGLTKQHTRLWKFICSLSRKSDSANVCPLKFAVLSTEKVLHKIMLFQIGRQDLCSPAHIPLDRLGSLLVHKKSTIQSKGKANPGSPWWPG